MIQNLKEKNNNNNNWTIKHKIKEVGLRGSDERVNSIFVQPVLGSDRLRCRLWES